MNKDLLIDGKVYISATRASKRVGYAPDYIGQLARANKICSRLIGKTWYVELDSVLNHKKTRKLGKRKKSEESSVLEYHVNSSALVVPFLPATSPRVPKKVVTKKSFVFARIVASALVLFVVTVASFAYFENFASQAVTKETSANSFFGWVENIFGAKRQGNILGDGTVEGDGIVVLPQSKSSAGVISQIKNAFSDGVEVSIDKENDSGVIKPVFRQGGDYEDYAFVLVPVEETKQ